ncbi:E3 ubiquitin-protein ligase, putative [Plasmodium malariae]|uniref:RING-type E3 ubiquitin transferase n=1 Tax=Plasmodium malariae TaxID=5858 RepID=A0A1C3KYR3_PLAMA|nr:E3 ubiquitin-protein ligase, putative [Plasmodium malariae]
MNSNSEQRGLPDEGEERNGIFLYNNETNNEGESCNILCLFLFFISLFFIMIMTADNAVQQSSEYDNSSNANIHGEESSILNNYNDRKMMNDVYENVLIQSINFKGHYKIRSSDMSEKYGTEKWDRNDLENKEMHNEKKKQSFLSHGGNFEAKMITLKLALHNVTKVFVFFHFDPYNSVSSNNEEDKLKYGVTGNKKKDYQNSEKRKGIKKKKYEFLGLTGININRKNNFIFNGTGYNISTFCQSKEEKCLCNYTININQNVNMYESTSLRELEESYLYSLKNYLMNEPEYYNEYISSDYYQQYEKYLNHIEQYYNDNIIKREASDYSATTPPIGTNIHADVDKNGETNVSKTNSEPVLGAPLGASLEIPLKEPLEVPPLSTTTDDRFNSVRTGDAHAGGEANIKEGTATRNPGAEDGSDGEGKENDTSNSAGKRKANYDGYILSNNCNIFISFEGEDIDKRFSSAKVINFSILFNIKSLIELGLFWSQIGYNENMRNMAKTSLISICLNSFIEIFESLLLLYEVMLSKLLLIHFIIMVLLKFLLFTLMEVRYILIIWKANHQQDINDGWEQMQRKLSILYKYYYGSILLVIILFYYVFPFCPYVLLVLYLCWFPQILLDIWKGQRNSVNLKFVFSLSLCRLFLPIYIYLYPYNIFQLDVFAQVIGTSNTTFSILLIILMITQLILMFLQRKYGPRYFINTDILPHVHNYYKTIDANFEAGIPECVICMYDIVLKDNTYCVTPCYHIFHENCLQQWMNVKLECPTCRGALPNFP